MTPYEAHKALSHATSRYSPNGIDTIEECIECGRRWLFHPTDEYSIELPPHHPNPVLVEKQRIATEEEALGIPTEHRKIGMSN